MPFNGLTVAIMTGGWFWARSICYSDHELPKRLESTGICCQDEREVGADRTVDMVKLERLKRLPDSDHRRNTR